VYSKAPEVQFSHILCDNVSFQKAVEIQSLKLVELKSTNHHISKDDNFHHH